MTRPEQSRARRGPRDPEVRLLLWSLGFFLVALGLLVAGFVIGLFH